MRRLAVALALATGCGYTSSYVAPPDGRPRAVWREDHVAVEPAGAPISPGCAAALGLASGSDRLRLVAGDLKLAPPPPGAAPFVVAAAVWAPIFWGPPIVAPAPGLAPVLLAPPLFLPPPLLAVPHPLPTLVPVPVPGVNAPAIDDQRAWAVLAAIALVVLPAVAIGLALSRPEDSDKNAEAIDQVNAFNDLLRTAGSPCGGPAS